MVEKCADVFQNTENTQRTVASTHSFISKVHQFKSFLSLVARAMGSINARGMYVFRTTYIRLSSSAFQFNKKNNTVQSHYLIAAFYIHYMMKGTRTP